MSNFTPQQQRQEQHNAVIEELMFSPLENQLIGLLESGPFTRDALVEKTNEPRTTIFDNLIRLEEMGIVKRFSGHTNTVGRPHVYFTLTGRYEDAIREASGLNSNKN